MMDRHGWIRKQIEEENYRLSLHAQVEMIEDSFLLQDLASGLSRGVIIEDYPEARRGPCCLVSGVATDGRPIHIVCTMGGDILIIITVYEPKPPKWKNPSERGPQA